MEETQSTPVSIQDTSNSQTVTISPDASTLTSDNIANPQDINKTKHEHAFNENGECVCGGLLVAPQGSSNTLDGQSSHVPAEPIEAVLSNDSAVKPPKQDSNPNLNAGNNTDTIKWAEKWKTPEERIVACEQYCEYLRQGRSKKYYPAADENTIRRYMDVYPDEFRTEKIADAERAGLAAIESRLFAASVGKIPGANATLLVWISKNKLGWRDKVQVVGDDDYETEWSNGKEEA